MKKSNDEFCSRREDNVQAQVSYTLNPSVASVRFGYHFLILSVRYDDVGGDLVDMAEKISEQLYNLEQKINSNLTQKDLIKQRLYFRPRGIYYDDKNGGHSIYIDLIYNKGYCPKISDEEIKKIITDPFIEKSDNGMELVPILNFNITRYEHPINSETFSPNANEYYDQFKKSFVSFKI